MTEMIYFSVGLMLYAAIVAPIVDKLTREASYQFFDWVSQYPEALRYWLF